MRSTQDHILCGVSFGGGRGSDGDGEIVCDIGVSKLLSEHYL